MGAGPGYERVGRRRSGRWLTVLGLIAAAVVVLIAIMMLVGGEGHEPPVQHGAGGIGYPLTGPGMGGSA